MKRSKPSNERTPKQVYEDASQLPNSEEPSYQSEFEIALTLIQEKIVELTILNYMIVELILVYGCGLSPEESHEIVVDLFPLEVK